MSDKCNYKFTLNGKEIKARKIGEGTYAIPLRSAGENLIEANRIN